MGSPKPVDQSGYLGGSVEGEDDGEVLDVEEDHHVEMGQGRHSIHAIEEQGFPGEHSWHRHIPEVLPVGRGQSHPKTFLMCAIECGLRDWFPQSRSVGQRIGDLAELNGMNDFVMRYCSSSTWDIAIRHRISVLFGCRCHQVQSHEKNEQEEMRSRAKKRSGKDEWREEDMNE